MEQRSIALLDKLKVLGSRLLCFRGAFPELDSVNHLTHHLCERWRSLRAASCRRLGSHARITNGVPMYLCWVMQMGARWMAQCLCLQPHRLDSTMTIGEPSSLSLVSAVWWTCSLCFSEWCISPNLNWSPELKRCEVRIVERWSLGSTCQLGWAPTTSWLYLPPLFVLTKPHTKILWSTYPDKHLLAIPTSAMNYWDPAPAQNAPEAWHTGQSYERTVQTGACCGPFS